MMNVKIVLKGDVWMTEISLTLLDWAIILFEMVITMIVYAIIKGWYDNRRWEKHIYQILKQYRSKYGEDIECENLKYDSDD